MKIRNIIKKFKWTDTHKTYGYIQGIGYAIKLGEKTLIYSINEFNIKSMFLVDTSTININRREKISQKELKDITHVVMEYIFIVRKIKN